MLLTKIILLTLLTASTTMAKRKNLKNNDDQYVRYVPGDYLGDVDIVDLFNLEIGRDLIARDFLDLKHCAHPLQNPVSIRNSASIFLLRLYNDFKKKEHIQGKDEVEQMLGSDRTLRNTRSIRDGTFITEVDRDLVNESNHIITFSSDASNFEQVKFSRTHNKFVVPMIMLFNTNDIPNDMKLVHSSLRIYQKPSLGVFEKLMITSQISITVVQNIYQLNSFSDEIHILSTINSTTEFEGWYEFNITRTVTRWLWPEESYPTMTPGELIVIITPIPSHDVTELDADDIGLIKPNTELIGFHPFIANYFNGPKLVQKVKTLMYKRKRKAGYSNLDTWPKSCAKLNFTLDFNELDIRKWVIAPKKFEAFFCAGGCKFPLEANTRFTKNAVIQHNMHIMNPEIPPACCAPFDLGAISILHYRNEDNIQLSLYPDSIAICCGCW